MFSKTRRLQVAIAAAALIAVPAVALADTLTVNDVTTGADASVAVGATGNAKLQLNVTDNNGSDPLNGCNAGSATSSRGDERVKFSVSASTNRADSQPVISLSSSEVLFAECTAAAGGTQQVSFSALRSGTAVISASYVTGGKRDSNGNILPAQYKTSDTMTVTVSGPTLAAPTVSGALSGGTLGNPGWYTAAPTATWTLGGGLAASFGGHCDNAGAFRGSASVGSIDTDSGSVTCSATNAAGTASDTLTYKLDSMNPSISVTGVSAGAIYYVGTTIPTAGCSQATDATSGVASSSASPTLTGGLLGALSATCSATDFAGNVGSDRVNYSVLYERDGGILQPINPDGNSVFSQKRAVPVKFQLKNDAPDGFNVAGWQVKREAQQCGSESWSVESPDPAMTSETTGLRYDPAADQYIANATLNGTTVDKCYRFVVVFNDGTSLASPKFKVGR